MKREKRIQNHMVSLFVCNSWLFIYIAGKHNIGDEDRHGISSA